MRGPSCGRWCRRTDGPNCLDQLSHAVALHGKFEDRGGGCQADAATTAADTMWCVRSKAVTASGTVARIRDGLRVTAAPVRVARNKNAILFIEEC